MTEREQESGRERETAPREEIVRLCGLFTFAFTVYGNGYVYV